MIADPERIATELGTEPLVLLLWMIGLSAGVLAIVALVTQWAARHGRTLWRAGLRVWRWVEQRSVVRRIEARFPSVARALRELDPDEYLVMHAALGFALTLAGMVFVELADEVMERSTIVRIDLALAASLHASATTDGLEVFRFITFFGGTPGLYIVSTLVTIVLFWRRRRLMVIGWLIAMVGVAILNTALKLAFARPRPTFDAPHEVAAGWSFPSGHAMATIVAAGMLAYFGLIVARRAPIRVVILLGAVTWTVAMGFSRLYLGVHYLSDVVAGFAAGTVWLSACISGLEIARRPQAPERQGRDDA